MDYYLNLINTIGIHTLLGLSAYLLILTGQVSMAQAGFFGIGAYTAAILTVIFEWSILSAIGAAMLVSGGVAFLVGFPALRVRGLMLVDGIKNGEVNLVINTPMGAQARYDEEAIGRSCIQKGIQAITTLSGAAAVVRAIRLAGKKIEVKSIQEYHN